MRHDIMMNRRWKYVSRDSLVLRSIRRVRGAIHSVSWELRGRKGPPPGVVKRRMIRRLGEQFALDVLVETGTYMGDTVAALRPHFRRIISIELSPQLAAAATERFAAVPSVTILVGDSAQTLPHLLGGLDGPALFWLDGHWSGGVTARGDIVSPIVAELEAVLSDRYEHVVLIDDARLFVGSDGYPTQAALRELVGRFRPNAAVHVRNDVISVVP